jgi:hypothetical protein
VNRQHTGFLHLQRVEGIGKAGKDLVVAPVTVDAVMIAKPADNAAGFLSCGTLDAAPCFDCRNAVFRGRLAVFGGGGQQGGIELSRCSWLSSASFTSSLRANLHSSTTSRSISRLTERSKIIASYCSFQFG